VGRKRLFNYLLPSYAHDPTPLSDGPIQLPYRTPRLATPGNRGLSNTI